MTSKGSASGAESKPLRLMIYDRTGKAFGKWPGLAAAWRVGGALYSVGRRLDGCFGAATWEDALDWLASYERDRAIAEIQVWSHGHWGKVLVQHTPMTIAALQPAHPWYSRLAAIRARLTGPSALWWFRTCETFATAAGHEFAREWSKFFHCRVAGHTYAIAVAHSGLHILDVGQTPSWPEDEGVVADAEGKRHPLWSTADAPNTIFFWNTSLPSE